MNEELIFIEHPELPDTLSAGLILLPDWYSSEPQLLDRNSERRRGRELIEMMVTTVFGSGKVVIKGEENEKPTGFYDEVPLCLSISHTRGVIAGVVSRKINLGLDLERIDRKVSEGLMDRMIHPQESDVGKQLAPIRLWTVKEAALKWLGTGLRTAMKKVKVTGVDGNTYRVTIHDEKSLSVCSFVWRNYWVSIAYAPETSGSS